LGSSSIQVFCTHWLGLLSLGLGGYGYLALNNYFLG
jgi:hypothetical protein